MSPFLNCAMILESLLVFLFFLMVWHLQYCIVVVDVRMTFFFLRVCSSFPQGFESEQVETLQNFKSDYR